MKFKSIIMIGILTVVGHCYTFSQIDTTSNLFQYLMTVEKALSDCKEKRADFETKYLDEIAKNKRFKTEYEDLKSKHEKLQLLYSMSQELLDRYMEILTQKNILIGQKNEIIQHLKKDINDKQKEIENLNVEIKGKDIKIQEITSQLNKVETAITIIKSMKMIGVLRKGGGEIRLTSENPVRRRKLKEVKVQFDIKNFSEKEYHYTVFCFDKDGNLKECIPADKITIENNQSANISKTLFTVDKKVFKNIFKKEKYKFSLSEIDYSKYFILK